MTPARLALLLPLGAFLLLWGLLSAHRARLGIGRLSLRGTAVLAFLGLEALLLAVTELLNLGHHIRSGPVALAWLVVVVGLAALFVATGVHQRASAWLGGGAIGRRWTAAVGSVPVLVGLGLLLAVAGALAAEAWLYLPNNADSNVYHLARVASWAQAASIDHFATHALAQLELAPLHEITMLQLHVLADTDRLDGFVQLAAFAVCVVAASELARLLGAGREVQVGAAVIAAVVPSALLEAASTQNNLFAAALGMGLVMVLLAWEPLGRWGVPAVALGLAGGMAVLTKGTVLALLGPVVLLLAARVAWREARASSWGRVARRGAGVALVAGLVALLVLGPFLKRNHDLFGGFGGPVTSVTLNTETSARASAGNVVRSVATQFRVGDGGSDPRSLTSRAVLGTLEVVHGWTGARTDDPAFLIGPPIDAFAPGDFSAYERGEDYGSNPGHVLLMLATLLILAVRAVRGDRGARLPLAMAGALAAGFVLFTATTRWSLYVSRYQLPLLVLWCPLIAVALGGLHRFLLRGVVVLLVVASLPALLDNLSRPLLDRSEPASDIDRYFAPRPDELQLVPPADYVALRDALVASGCERVGLGNVVLFEYPLWGGLRHAGWDGEIRHVDVENASGVLEDRDFEPCAIVRDTRWNGAVPPLDGYVDERFGGLTLSLRAP